MNILFSIDPVFAFFRQQLQSYYIPHHFYFLCCFSYSPRKRSKNLYFQIGQLKRSEKGLLLIWHCCHEQNLMGLFSSVSIEKKLFFSLLSRLLEVTTSWHQFRLAVWHCSFGLLLSFSLPIPTKEI